MTELQRIMQIERPVEREQYEKTVWRTGELQSTGHVHGHTTWYYTKETCPICNRKPRRKSTRVRDSQRSKVYTAENGLWSHEKPDLESMLYVKLFIDKVVASPYYRKHYKSMTVDVRDGRRRSKACAEGGWYGHGIIRMPKWSRSRLIALHEIAHLAVHRNYGREAAGHGREFAEIYIDLVRHVMGAEKAEQLQAAFKQHGVKFRPKRKGSGNRKGNAEALRKWREARKAVIA